MVVGLGCALQAIREFSKVGKPIYITETGIADAKDTLRAEWAEAYFRAVGFSLCTCRGSLLSCLTCMRRPWGLRTDLQANRVRCHGGFCPVSA